MNRFETECLESILIAKDFSAMKGKGISDEIIIVSPQYVRHLASLYTEQSYNSIKYYLKDIRSVISSIIGIKQRSNNKPPSAQKYFTSLWRDMYDDFGDESCERRLKLQIEARQLHEKHKLNINNLESFAIFCRTFTWFLSERLSTGGDVSKEDLYEVYNKLQHGDIPEIPKSIKMYW